MSHKRQAYTSDLTDDQWAWLEPQLEDVLTQNRLGRPMKLELREVLNTILYVVRNGVAWANVPHDLLNPNSVYYHFRKWCLDGTWRYLNQALRRYDRLQRKRKPNPSAAIIDSQSVKTTEAGGVRGFDAGKRVNGRKRHIVVDTIGNLLDVVVHAANIQDYHGAKHVLRKVTETVDTLQRIWADGMYEKDGLVEWVRDTLQIALDVVKRPPDQQGFVVLPRRWVVERSFAWLGRYRRLSKDYERCTHSSEGIIYVASIHTMLRRIPA